MTIARFSTLLFSLLLGTCACAQTDLSVRVTGITSPGEGTLVYLLYASEDGFPKDHDRAFRRGELSDFGEQGTHHFRGIPAGTYAVVVYQDLNDNGKMDTNFLGIPREPLVASNMTKMARPSFRRSAVELSDTPKTLTVKLLNQ